ncbi:Transcription factor IIIB 90 kDa subunit [Morus notabilis]|uniref:Transcription factor IIIB 90 kDa subunit n=1 Tax=Morus notabilis TaxID=981085 RepID=W9SN90_9ROSA|nr:Transcription factor IIIB 90 kDa subunit [Morus notabilis]
MQIVVHRSNITNMQIAVHRNFTRGRRTPHVAAACLYIACRTAEPPKPFLLIDFSETLAINVYVLGSVFLQLCQLLSLVEHALIKRPVDPTLFIPRFTETLLKGRNVEVSRTAMHIIASMKRDWMQTGRKPSGLCGAALYISALAHGFQFSKSDIVKIVHVCEVTLTKRLIEFENTDSGSLTIEELDNSAKELKKSKLPSLGSQKSQELLCRHKDSGQPPFAHGLCQSCYEDFIEISGGLGGGSDPPAFQQAEKMRAANESAKKSDESDVGFVPANKEKPTELGNETDENIESFTEPSQKAQHERSDTTKLNTASDGTTDGASDTCNKFDASTMSGEESDGLSDIDDIEVNDYLNNEEETRYKKIIWEEMNREYLEEQAAKMEAGEGLSAPKPRKERRQKQDPNAPPAQTAAEAARQMLSKKRFSSKINYEALEKCFSGDVGPNKKAKVSGQDDDEDDGSGKGPGGNEKKSDFVDKEDEIGEEYEDMEEGAYDEETAGYQWPLEEDGYDDCGYDEDDL